MTLYNYIELLPSLWKSWYDTAPDRWFGSSRPQNSSVTFTSLIWKIAYFSSPNSFKGTGSINTSALNALKAVKKKIKEKCKATYQVNAKAVFGCMWGHFFILLISWIIIRILNITRKCALSNVLYLISYSLLWALNLRNLRELLVTAETPPVVFFYLFTI